MKIRTLGDLLKITEAELLSYKNFGETSLVEIKAMLSQKGLRLGQGLEGQYSQVRKEIYEELRGARSHSQQACFRFGAFCACSKGTSAARRSVDR